MDFYSKYINLAIDGLLSNKFRVFLSILGLSLGIASVIMVIALSLGAYDTIRNFYFTREGWYIIKPDLLVFPGTELKYDTCKTIELNCPGVITVIPYKITKRKFTRPSCSGETIIGTVDGNLTQNIKKGRFFTKEDVMMSGYVCVMVESDIFVNPLYYCFWNAREPLGETTPIENIPLKLVAVLEPDPFGQGFGINDIVMPVTTLMNITGDRTLTRIEVKMSSMKSDEEAIELLREILKIDYGYKYAHFNIESALEGVRDKAETVKFSNMVLLVIALLTMSVAGTGIINILIVSVYERTLEIGIRRSLGATRREILIQFLVESSIICIMGGLTGILIAYPSVNGLIHVINKYGLYNIRLSEHINWPLLVPFSLIFSLFLGLIFGVYPASYAANLDVVECLRSQTEG
ncbi:MAG: ABC transporter permease [Candidatus Eremiobacterota bacterium]